MQDRLGRTLKVGQKILYVKASQFNNADPLVLGQIIGDNVVKLVMHGASEKIYVHPLDSNPKGAVLKDVWLTNPRHIVIVEDMP